MLTPEKLISTPDREKIIFFITLTTLILTKFQNLTLLLPTGPEHDPKLVFTLLNKSIDFVSGNPTVSNLVIVSARILKLIAIQTS
jgi:hypothetical protein